jgi:hypothetical protein
MPKNIPGHWANVWGVCCIYIEVSHSITQRRGPLEYNSGMMGVQSKSNLVFLHRFFNIPLLYFDGPRNKSCTLSKKKKKKYNVGQSDMHLSPLALPCLKILLVQGWGFLPTFWWVGSWLPTYLPSFFHQVERRFHSGN